MLKTMPAQGTPQRLAALKKRHDDLEHKIDEARTHQSISDFYLNELKKQKLMVRDMIEQLTGQSTPFSSFRRAGAA